jgi:hypothetical protein
MKQIFKKLLLAFSIGAVTCADAQQTWYFGNNAGIKFTGGSTAIATPPSALNTGEGSSVLVDASNNVIMYCDGVTVRNGAGTWQMAGLYGHSSSTQGVQIVPVPSTNLAFIFTLHAAEYAYGVTSGSHYGLYATLVSVSGTAPATTVSLVPGNYNIRLTGTNNIIGEKLGIVADGAGGYWVVVHGVGIFDNHPTVSGSAVNIVARDKFFAYNVKCSTTSIAALDATEKVSTITNPAMDCESHNHPVSVTGLDLSYGDPQLNGQGQMKIFKSSTTTAKIACTLPYGGNLNWIVNPVGQLYDLDLTNGIVSNSTALQFPLGFNTTASSVKDGVAAGVEFSSSGRFLYISGSQGSIALGWYTPRVYRYDLLGGPSAPQLVASLPATNIAAFGHLQRGPNGKIYIARYNQTYIDVINNPDNVSIGAVGYSSGVAVATGSNKCLSGLPNIVFTDHGSSTPLITSANLFCANSLITVTGSYSGQTPAFHFWEIYGSDASGIPVNSSGTPVANTTLAFYNFQQWQLDAPAGPYTFPGSSSLACNKYYTIKLALTDNCGSWTEVTKTIYIQCYPTPTITSSVPNPVCVGSSVTLCTNYTPGGLYTIDWANAVYNYPSPGDNTQCITTLPNQTLNYTVGVNWNGCRSTATYQIVMDQANANFSLSTLANSSGVSFTMAATPTVIPASGVSYLWKVEQLDPLTGLPVSGTTAMGWPCWSPSVNNFNGYNYLSAPGACSGSGTPVGVFEFGKEYRVTYETSTAYCTQSSYLDSNPSHAPIGYINEQEDGSEILSDEANQIVENNIGFLSITPNPSTGLFTVNSSTGTFSVQVSDAYGRSVFKNMSSEKLGVEIDLSKFGKGIYFVTAVCNGKQETKKVIVQ